MKTFILLFSLSQAFAGAPKYAPVEGVAVVTLAGDSSYLRAAPAPDFWALASFYLPQRNGASCSSASAAMALNALLNAGAGRSDEDENITEASLVARVRSVPWAGLASEAGHGGRHGLKLAQLEAGLREAFSAFGGTGTVAAVEVSTSSGGGLEAFRRALAAGEASADDLLLLHYAQDALTGAPGGPFAHISPVGAYDAVRGRVLIMDVDRRWYEPYWAPVERVYGAMAVKTKQFGHGGYVRIAKDK